jgi:hypothetical protein
MRKLALTILAGGALAVFSVAANSPAAAQSTGARGVDHATAAQPIEATAQQRRRRAPTQLRVYRDRAYLPPNAVRTCDAWYEQEFRPSGTVIVPRMRCRWVAG